MSYQRLDGAHVAETIGQVRARIHEFIPVSKGLPAVAGELQGIVERINARANQVARRRWLITWGSRLLIVVIVGLAVIALFSAVRDALAPGERIKAFEWLPVLESGINDVVFAGVAVWFLASAGQRLVRNELLDVLHRLRSLAHVIDMHQMNKNVHDLMPEESEHPGPRSPTESSGNPEDPEDFAYDRAPGSLTRREYALYLDYCSELLSLTAKAAALCAEESSDSLVLDTVSEIETLTTGMSRKIWQKVSLLHGHANP